MIEKMKEIKLLFFVISVCATFFAHAGGLPTSVRAENAIASVEAKLKQELAVKELTYGAPIFMRIFKAPNVLEVWLENNSGEFELFKSYDICAFSGSLGPKLKEGDNQSPEGFYYVNASQLNPWSRFHLSFNLGYPNKYDRSHGRTGSALMVHGSCVSIGCYAMTDAYMNEIYALSSAALSAGQPFFRVHAFPFYLSSEALERHQSSQWYTFWKNLKTGYDYFNQHKRPPNVEVKQGKYVFGT